MSYIITSSVQTWFKAFDEGKMDASNLYNRLLVAREMETQVLTTVEVGCNPCMCIGPCQLSATPHWEEYHAKQEVVWLCEQSQLERLYIEQQKACLLRKLQESPGNVDILCIIALYAKESARLIIVRMMEEQKAQIVADQLAGMSIVEQ